MKKLLLLALGIVGMVAAVSAFKSQGGPALQTGYYPSGRLQFESEYQDGQRHGMTRKYWPDGTRMAEGSYEQGQMEGAWSWWHEDGRPDEERSGDYAAGRRTGG